MCWKSIVASFILLLVHNSDPKPNPQNQQTSDPNDVLFEGFGFGQFKCPSIGYFPVKGDCRNYYTCVMPSLYTFGYTPCPFSTVFDPVRRRCDRPANVDCNKCEKDGYFKDPKSKYYYIHCQGGAGTRRRCYPHGHIFSEEKSSCVQDESIHDKASHHQESTTTSMPAFPFSFPAQDMSFFDSFGFNQQELQGDKTSFAAGENFMGGNAEAGQFQQLNTPNIQSGSGASLLQMSSPLPLTHGTDYTFKSTQVQSTTGATKVTQPTENSKSAPQTTQKSTVNNFSGSTPATPFPIHSTVTPQNAISSVGPTLGTGTETSTVGTDSLVEKGNDTSAVSVAVPTKERISSSSSNSSDPITKSGNKTALPIESVLPAVPAPAANATAELLNVTNIVNRGSANQPQNVSPPSHGPPKAENSTGGKGNPQNVTDKSKSAHETGAVKSSNARSSIPANTSTDHTTPGTANLSTVTGTTSSPAPIAAAVPPKNVSDLGHGVSNTKNASHSSNATKTLGNISGVSPTNKTLATSGNGNHPNVSKVTDEARAASPSPQNGTRNVTTSGTLTPAANSTRLGNNETAISDNATTPNDKLPNSAGESNSTKVGNATSGANVRDAKAGATTVGPIPKPNTANSTSVAPQRLHHNTTQPPGSVSSANVTQSGNGTGKQLGDGKGLLMKSGTVVSSNGTSNSENQTSLTTGPPKPSNGTTKTGSGTGNVTHETGKVTSSSGNTTGTPKPIVNGIGNITQVSNGTSASSVPSTGKSNATDIGAGTSKPSTSVNGISTTNTTSNSSSAKLSNERTGNIPTNAPQLGNTTSGIGGGPPKSLNTSALNSTNAETDDYDGDYDIDDTTGPNNTTASSSTLPTVGRNTTGLNKGNTTTAPETGLSKPAAGKSNVTATDLKNGTLTGNRPAVGAATASASNTSTTSSTKKPVASTLNSSGSPSGNNSISNHTSSGGTRSVLRSAAAPDLPISTAGTTQKSVTKGAPGAIASTKGLAATTQRSASTIGIASAVTSKHSSSKNDKAVTTLETSESEVSNSGNKTSDNGYDRWKQNHKQTNTKKTSTKVEEDEEEDDLLSISVG